MTQHRGSFVVAAGRFHDTLRFLRQAGQNFCKRKGSRYLFVEIGRAHTKDKGAALLFAVLARPGQTLPFGGPFVLNDIMFE